MAQPRILFIRLGAIGDVVRTLPALHIARRRLPEAFLAWIVEESASPILLGHPDLDEVILLERSAFARELGEPSSFFPAVAALTRFALELRGRCFTVSLDFQGTLKSGLVALAAGAPVRAGYDTSSVKEGNHLFSNRKIALPSQREHRIDRNLALLEAIGLNERYRGEAAGLPILDRHRAEADRALAAAGAGARGYVFLYPGSSRRQAYKRYPAHRWVEVAAGLIEAGVDCVLGSGPGEEELAESLRAGAGPGLKVLPPTSLLAMAEIIRRARLFIGGDTGPMHLAALQGVSVVALFGPTDPALNAPRGRGHRVLDALLESAPGAQPAQPPPSGAAPPPAALPPAGRRAADPAILDALKPLAIVEAALECLRLTEPTAAAEKGEPFPATAAIERPNA